MASLMRDIGYRLMYLEPYPYLDLAHSLLTCFYFRNQVGPTYTQRYPVESFIFCMLTIFAGEICGNFLLGDPILQVFNNNYQMLIAAGCWYFMFFVPCGFGAKLVRSMPVKIPLVIGKEIYRCRKIYDGVNRSAYYYKNSAMAKIIVGVVRGNSGGFVRQVRARVFGTGSQSHPWAMDIPTLRSLMAAAIFTLDRDFFLIPLPIEELVLGIIAFFVYFKVYSVLDASGARFGCRSAFKFYT